mmetsp:Transcript_57875/g.172155  ORF Transcript_57875/g.172155 Transcript_57875/m.172155 type:complete len:470 (-) Transcript_57875:24-1433(-)
MEAGQGPVGGPAGPELAGGAGPEELVEISVVDPLLVAGDDDPGEFDPQSGVPKVLKAYSIPSFDGGPRLSLVPHFVSDAEIEHLLRLAEGSWEPSEVGSGVYRSADESKDLSNAVSSRRTSYSCMLEPLQTPVVTRIERRLSQLAGIGIDYLEPLNMVRYAPGQFFKTHHDGRFRPKTVFIYLNDLPEGDGGETLFPELRLQVMPRRGCALMWDNVLGPQQDDRRMVHQGLPPRTAVKFGVNCFFNDKRMKAYRPDGGGGGGAEALPGALPAAAGGECWRTIDAAELARETGRPHSHLGPGQLRRLRAADAPPVWVAPELLSPEEAARVLALSDTGMRLEAPGDRELVSSLQLRAGALAGLPVDCLELMEVSKIGPEGSAVDCSLPPDAYRTRFGAATVFVFLNTLDEGGELRLPSAGLRFAARAGCAVAWGDLHEAEGGGACTRHEALPPRSGRRYGLFCMFRGAGAK